MQRARDYFVRRTAETMCAAVDGEQTRKALRGAVVAVCVAPVAQAMYHWKMLRFLLVPEPGCQSQRESQRTNRYFNHTNGCVRRRRRQTHVYFESGPAIHWRHYWLVFGPNPATAAAAIPPYTTLCRHTLFQILLLAACVLCCMPGVLPCTSGQNEL